MGKHLQTVAAVTCMKSLLMLFNVAFWLTGVVILALGIWMYTDLYKYMELSTEFSETAPYILIATGSAIILIGSLACCCTVKGQPVLLYIFSAFLLVVFVVELSSGVSGYAYRKKLQLGFERGLNESLRLFGTDEEKTDAINRVQKTLRCCGIDSYQDWSLTPSGLPPESCCIEEEECSTSNPEDIYRKGCYKFVITFLDANMSIIAGTALGVAFYQLVGVLLACCLANNINKARYEELA